VLFNSLEFILFGVLVFAAWPLVRRRNNFRWGFLVVCSFFFYGWWDWRFLFLITFSGLIDYGAALAMFRWPSRRKLFLILSIFGNIGSLAVFKYGDFFFKNLNAFLGLTNLGSPLPLPDLLLPVGISFYTFQSMSYTIDVYRRQLTPTRNILHFFAYLAMFPQLVAGPIVRACDLLPQLRNFRRTSAADRWEACRLIVYGFFKKVVVADTVAATVTAAFAAKVPESSCSYWWVVMTLFAFQIYCDFSGYSDIARGLARWMGYDFPLNFDHPYISRSFREFWSRWHISLSTWFRDYVYIPLGGSRGSTVRSQGNLWATMVISGLWHGANWTFVAWGGLHAALLSAERVTKWPKRLARIPGGKHLAVLIVFALTLVTWVFFRAKTFDKAAVVIGNMFNFGDLDLSAVQANVHIKDILVVGIIGLRQLWVYAKLDDTKLSRGAVGDLVRILGVAVLIAACIFLRGPGEDFIYFQF
jgi:alginate O-acetyltransferase complex protein AlgI